MTRFRSQTVLLCVHEYANFSSIIKESLEGLGFHVIQIDTKQEKFHYNSFLQRVTNFIKKTFLQDTTYKLKLKQKILEDKILKQLDKIDTINYSLLIRADILSLTVIKNIREKTDLMCGYQWDGLARFPTIYKYIPLFDRFFVFDPTDLLTKNTSPITNFYFNQLTTVSNNNTPRKAIFIGSYFENRNNTLKQITEALKSSNIESNIQIFTDKPKEIERVHQLGFTPIEKVQSYRETCKNVLLSASILIDVNISEHNGLSFRIFEALGYGKKIITTNTNIIHYDFYNPNNIYIWHQSNIQKLEKFISSPYQQVNDDLKQKYSFSNWIAYVFDNQPYTTIHLPE